MKKLFIFGDAHSFYDELKEALLKNGYEKDNSDHILVSLGDLCDRGPKSEEILDFINSIPAERKICIVGNHELLMEKMIQRKEALAHDVQNRTLLTAEQLTREEDDNAVLAMKECLPWNEYKKSWVWYAELGDMIFVHGWIPCDTRRTKYGLVLEARYKKNWRSSGPAALEQATWLNGMRAWSEGVKEPGKTIFCGHWHTSWGHANLRGNGVEFLKKVETVHITEDGTTWPYACYDTFEDDGIVALDACTAVSGKVNIAVREVEDLSDLRLKKYSGISR